MSSKVLLSFYAILVSGPIANAISAQPWPDSSIHSILLPSDQPPMEPEDSYECVFENVTQYYDPPMPTGALLDALFDFGDAMFQACEAATGADTYDCYPEKDEWCKFNTERPDKVSEDLSAWGSTVSSWWAEHSSKAVEVAQECPQYWYEAGLEDFEKRSWLNKTVIFAGCGASSPSGSDTTTSDSLGGATSTADAASREGETSAVSTSTTQPDQDDAGRRRIGREEMWMVAGGGILAAMANAVL